MNVCPQFHSTCLGILKELEWKAVSSRIMAVMSWEPVEAEDCGSNTHDEV